MITSLVLYLMIVQVNEFTPRIQTLRFHISRLEQITVPENLEAEKKNRINALYDLMDTLIADEAAFNACYTAIDEVRQWLWKVSPHRPQPPQSSFVETNTSWSISNDFLSVQLDKSTLALQIKTPKQLWQFGAAALDDLEFSEGKISLLQAASITAQPLDTGYSTGMCIRFSQFPLEKFELVMSFYLIGSELVLDMAAKEGNETFWLCRWPKAIQLSASPETLSVLPRMQGMLLPGNWPQHIQSADLCNSRTLYMPWWGHIQNGAGVQIILETDDDAGCEYVHPYGGPTQVTPRWYGSLGKFRYLRTIRYVFDDECTYVRMAKRYRQQAQEMGRFVSLREKLARTPSLQEVIGKPVIHLGALYHFVPEAALFNKKQIEANHSLQTFDQLAAQLEQLKEKGVDSAYVHLDGWGYYGYDNGHPDVLPPGELQGGWDGLRHFAEVCSRLGYLFAVHDQYRDFYFNAASFDDRLAAVRFDGSREEHSTWCGGPQTILSARFAPEYVRRNHDLFREHGITVRGAYLDVFSVVPLEESAQLAHPMTRSECARYRRACFDRLRARGYVVSSEEPADYLVSTLDLVHHGPYATYPSIGTGDACGIPVPLFSLVYHDALLIPWSMEENGGWGIPKGDSGRLHCLLNAGLPYLHPGADDVSIQRVLEAASWAEHCAFAEMVNHEFLSEDFRRQKAFFSNGATVTVDFTTGDCMLQR